MGFALIATLASLGVIGGFAAGLLGFGGGVLMFPLLFYVLPLLGLERLDAKAVAAVVMSQVFFSTLVGGIAHLRSGHVQGRIALIAGVFSAAGSLVGAVASKWTSERFLLVLFGIVTAVVILMMILPAPDTRQEEVATKDVAVRTGPLAVYSIAVGIMIGFLGAGNFVFVPLLIYVLKAPTRAAIGSSLFIASMNSATGFVGKLITGQVPILVAAILVASGAVGALAGEKVHRHLAAPLLRKIYAIMVSVIALRVWLTIFGVD